MTAGQNRYQRLRKYFSSEIRKIKKRTVVSDAISTSFLSIFE